MIFTLKEFKEKKGSSVNSAISGAQLQAAL